MKGSSTKEIKELKLTLAPMEEELKILLLPKDDNGKNVVVEVRGAAKVEMKLNYLLLIY